MSNSLIIVNLMLLIPLAGMIAYYDVYYRRIPNALVLVTLVSGLLVNTFFNGLGGTLASLQGCALAFALLLVLHICGAMGAGDVKLFAAIGAVIGLQLVLPAFVIIVMMGLALAIYSMLRAGTVRSTMQRVLHIFLGLLPGWEMPRYDAPADRRFTIPYGVAITLGSLISLAFSRA